MSDSAEPSLKKRYAFKLAANAANIPLNLAVNMVAPRLLGSSGFGVFSFLADFFAAVAGFLDCGTSTYFYNRLSQKPDEHGFKRFYAGLVLVIIGGCILCVSLINVAGLAPLIWPNTTTRLVWYGLAFAMFTWLSQVLNKMVDAYGLTVAGELVRVGHRIFLASSLGLFLLLEADSLDAFFLCQILLMALLCCAWAELLRRKGVVVVPGNKLAKEEIRSMAREAWSYSSPLLVFSAVNLLALLVDRWILQKFFGTQQQGYFGLGLKVGTVCFLFTSAMTPLLMREFSKAVATGDTERIRRDFRRFLPGFFMLSAYFGIFTASQAETVTLLFGGEEEAHGSNLEPKAEVALLLRAKKLL